MRTSSPPRGSLLAVLTVLAAGAMCLPQEAPAAGPVVRAASATASGPPESTVTIDGADYPDPLRTNEGDPVRNPAAWEGTRRAELLADFRQHVYGEPLPNPDRQRFTVTSRNLGDVTRKKITISITGPEGSGSFDLTLFLPKTGSKPRGTFLLIDHRGSVGDDPTSSSEFAPVSKINEAGYALASFDANDVAPDKADSYRSKMINLFHPSAEKLPDDAGRTISAWAWGASRAMDYLQTDPDIDPGAVAVIGHSRGGKASLWAGAQDQRFAAVVTNNSGSTGTSLARRAKNGAETLSRINSSFPHWFPQTYKAFNDRESSLPVDQHELLALVAPRRVVVGSATDDANSDPEGEFQSYVAAARVYALYGLGDTGLPSSTWRPTADKDFRGPAMSYHLRSGGHGLTAADWDTYLNGDLFSR